MAITYGFIGCGNMGGALIRAAAKNIGENRILITDKLEERSRSLADETGAATASAADIAASADFIFLGVKPQTLEDMLSEIRGTLAKRTDRFVLVSMAAGTPVERIIEYAGKFPVIRIMPNLAAEAGAGMILYCGKDVTEDETGSFLDLMKYAGTFCRLPEDLIDAGSAVSGCGPAYVFMFIEALADGGVQCGLPRKDAELLAAQTVLGSAELLMKSGRHPGELKDAVCSPGGTTIAGVHALELGAFRGLAAEAVICAYERTLEISRQTLPT